MMCSRCPYCKRGAACEFGDCDYLMPHVCRRCCFDVRGEEE